jgi:hypothetical protein
MQSPKPSERLPKKNEICILADAALCALMCKSSAEMCPHGSHSAPQNPRNDKIKTHKHPHSSVLLQKPGIADQCNCARRFEQSKHDLLCANARKSRRMYYQLHAPIGVKASPRKKKGVRRCPTLRVPVKESITIIGREFWSWSKYLQLQASRACRGTPRAAGSPPSCPCACGSRGKAS